MNLREPEHSALAGDGADAVPPIVIDLCVQCGLRPRAAGGRLSRCLACVKRSAEEDRIARALAEAKLAARVEQPTKRCRSCKADKPLDGFARHRLSRDGLRHDCRSCVANGKAKRRKPLTEAQREADRAARRAPHRMAANLESVIAWQTRNGAAREAHRVVDRAVRAGEVVPAKVCQGAGCKRRSGLVSHHNSYARNRRKRVVWLCQQHHRIVHSGRNLPLKRTAPVRFAKAPKTG
jgi:hypothetical protein